MDPNRVNPNRGARRAYQERPAPPGRESTPPAGPAAPPPRDAPPSQAATTRHRRAVNSGRRPGRDYGPPPNRESRSAAVAISLRFRRPTVTMARRPGVPTAGHRPAVNPQRRRVAITRRHPSREYVPPPLGPDGRQLTCPRGFHVLETASVCRTSRDRPRRPIRERGQPQPCSRFIRLGHRLVESATVRLALANFDQNICVKDERARRFDNPSPSVSPSVPVSDIPNRNEQGGNMIRKVLITAAAGIAIVAAGSLASSRANALPIGLPAAANGSIRSTWPKVGCTVLLRRRLERTRPLAMQITTPLLRLAGCWARRAWRSIVTAAASR